MSNWQKIETAPTDENTILLLWDGNRMVRGSWRTDDYRDDYTGWLQCDHDEFSTGFCSTPIDPTHWMPLPEPPTE